ncbi:MAG: dihydrolipoyl dehydrogenase [Paludibacterium sp.]|uniref:dihydrolipoyl dehydrogenase n=1 Tax=Paludibacterium sp. TaxID=1917523 RepID=UPI0025D90AA2|nr:dihydrolipoyl dehydrogenase [Paludibacterium sp.]MBV8045830.1 dihydrolipoyl dehydrogenase [Paludibacterium sp.]MBV8647612.1 dihydrolipoyl dehydrogenase [Paludibacterium sp.]
MSKIVELKVPDIGGHSGVDIIEIFVKPGDAIAVEDALLTLETDKATMDVPAAEAGVIKEVLVQVGGKVSEGDVIARLEVVDAGGVASAHTQTGETPVEAPVAQTHSGSADIECDVLVLGGGPGGYSAAFRAADLGLKTVVVERFPTLGGVCLNVGCIPSKALLHNAELMDEVMELAANGIKFAKPEIDIDALRGFKQKVVGKLTGGLAGMAKARKVEIVRGVGAFVDPYHLSVALTDGPGKAVSGEKKVVRFKQAIIAAGSRVVKLPFIPEDPRIIDSTGALELADVPQKMLIIGGGIIGLEMGTVYSSLGTRLDVVEMMDGLMQGADRDLVRVWQKMNSHRFDNVMLKTKTVAVEPREDGIWVTFEGENAPAGPQRYDKVLVAAGRAPNGKLIGAENAGVIVTERGFIPVDKQMRTNVPHIFAIGDLVGQPMLAHKAVHEAHVAAEVIAGHKAFFDARVIPGVAYTNPEVAWVGMTEEEAGKEGIKIGKSVFPWAASGRAIANGQEEGFTKLLFDAETHRIIGGGIVGAHAGDMIGEICLAIEMGCDPEDIGKTIHPHPTLGESIGMSAEVFGGVCTDLPPQRKK